MDLAELILALEPLVTDLRSGAGPGDSPGPGAGDGDDLGPAWDRVVELLDQHQLLAEYEVARFYVYDAIAGRVRGLLRSPDPRRRFRGVQAVRLTYPRTAAAQALRPLVKDPEPKVRGHARHAVRQLGLDDVALPDTRRPIPPWVRTIRPTTPGAWNPTGWQFGTVVRARRPSKSAKTEERKRHGLPALGSAADVARLVGLDRADDLRPLMRPGVESGAPYIEFTVPKADGSERRIAAPRARLKQVQRVILDQILARLPVHDACQGFVPGRSIVSNAAPHRGAAVLLKMDLRDFFPTVHYRRAQGFFQRIGYGEEVAATLAGLVTHRPVLADGSVGWPGVLPQGAPTSPALANLVCRRLDARLAGLARKSGAVYTRYADDLTFSFAAEPAVDLGRFAWWVDQICGQEGFVENTRKRRILRRGNQQRVTGVVVNDKLSVPRAARRRFRAILENCRRHGLASQARGRDDFADYLRGFAAYVQMVQPDLGARLVREVEEILAGAAGA
ncbi:MAG TPA: reverse transcriptase family protein, partial [Haliangium sp.]|nr:reverse transcriptase family protein [Haliangium sp.]